MEKKGLRIVTTSKCNNNCIFCIFKEIRKSKNSLKISRAKFVMKHYKEQKNFDNIFFTGGEPTLFKGLEELIKYAFEIGYKNVLIGSNGINFSDMNYCKKIDALGDCRFAISLHSLDYQINNYLSKNDSHYENVIQGLLNLKELKKIITVRIIITNKNYKGLPELCEFLNKIGIDQIQFQFYCLDKKETDKEKISLILKLSELKPFLEKAIVFCIKKQQSFDLLNFPFCFLEEYNKFNSNNFAEKEAISFDGEEFIDCLEQVNEFKIKQEACKSCSYNNACDGVWEYYIKEFGWEEFK